MFKKGTKIYSILKGYCPRCHQESMYSNKNAYNLVDTLKVNERCSNCNLKYRMEPSFFFGAMYVSYAVGVAFGVAAFVISFLIIGTSLKVAFISIVLILMLFMPIIMRLSRNIWINMFISYDKSLSK